MADAIRHGLGDPTPGLLMTMVTTAEPVTFWHSDARVVDDGHSDQRPAMSSLQIAEQQTAS